MKRICRMFLWCYFFAGLFRYGFSTISAGSVLPDLVLSGDTKFSYYIPVSVFSTNYGAGNLDLSISPATPLPSWLKLTYYGIRGVGNYSSSERGDPYCNFNGIKYRGDIVYVASVNCGFQTYDVSDPSDIHRLSAPYGLNYRDLDISEDGRFAYLVSNQYLVIYDISNPENPDGEVLPKLEGLDICPDPEKNLYGVEIYNDRYVFAIRCHAVYVIEITDLSDSGYKKNATVVSIFGTEWQYSDPAYTTALNKQNKLLIVSGNQGMEFIQFEYSEENGVHDLRSVGTVAGAGVRNIVFSTDNQYAYAITYHQDIGVYIISENMDPEQSLPKGSMLTLGTEFADGQTSMVTHPEYSESMFVSGINDIFGVVSLLKSEEYDLRPELDASISGVSFDLTAGGSSQVYTEGQLKTGHNPDILVQGMRTNEDIVNMISLGGIYIESTLSYDEFPMSLLCMEVLPLEIMVLAKEKNLAYPPVSNTSFTIRCESQSYDKSGKRVGDADSKAARQAVFWTFFLLSCCWCCCSVCCFCLLTLCLMGLIVLGGLMGLTIPTSIKIRKGLKDAKEYRKMDKIDKVLHKEFLGDGSDDIDGSSPNVKINMDLFVIKYENLEVIKMIGKGGSSSVVFHCKWKKTKDVAFKCFETRFLLGNQDNFSEFEREVEVSSSIRHPNIIRFYGCCLHPPRVGIVMEFCANGDLKQFLENSPEFPYKERMRILCQICDGMEHLHDRNVIHRDVKSENVLLDKSLIPKIMDFGVSKIYERMTVAKTKKVGTCFYMSPEVVLGNDYTTKCDVFSFSILMYEVLTNNFKNPYGGQSSLNIEYKIANDESFRPDVDQIKQVVRTEYPEVILMMRKSWEKDPDARPNFTVLKNTFLKYM